MKRLLVATQNPGKLKEFSNFLRGFTVVSLKDLGIDDDVIEDGKTFEENSRKKALFYAKKSGIPSLSDDGGLQIDALNGEPGVKSRRWIGYEATDRELREHLHNVITGLAEDNRSARFVTVVSFALPNKKVWSERGEIKGVLKEPQNQKHMEGYPFRSYFYLPEIQKFYHESDLDQNEMEKYNHRYIALKKLLPVISKFT